MTIMQNLQYTEHLAEPMAELVTVFAKEFDNDLLGEKVLGCVPNSFSFRGWTTGHLLRTKQQLGLLQSHY